MMIPLVAAEVDAGEVECRGSDGSRVLGLEPGQAEVDRRVREDWVVDTSMHRQ